MGVDALAGTPLSDVEFAEAGEADLVAATQRGGDCRQHSVDSVAGSLFAAKPVVASQLIQKLSSVTSKSSSGLKMRAPSTVGTA